MRPTGRFGLDQAYKGLNGVKKHASLAQKQYCSSGWPNFFEILYSDTYLLSKGILGKFEWGGMGVFKVEKIELHSHGLGDQSSYISELVKNPSQSPCRHLDTVAPRQKNWDWTVVWSAVAEKRL